MLDKYKSSIVKIMRITSIASPLIIILSFFTNLPILMILGIIFGITTFIFFIIHLQFKNTNFSIGFQSLSGTSKKFFMTFYVANIIFYLVNVISFFFKLAVLLGIFGLLSFLPTILLFISTIVLDNRYKSLSKHGRIISKADKKEARKIFKVGKELYSKRLYDKALESLNNAIELNPYERYFWLWKGYVLHDQGNFEEANACYDRCIELDYKSYKVWIAKAKACLMLKDYEEALLSINETLRILPEYKPAQELYQKISKMLFEN